MKTSIARKTIIPVFILFIVLIAVFFALSFKYIIDRYTEISRDRLLGIADDFAVQMSVLDTEDEGYSASLENMALALCRSFDLDYVSMYTPCDEGKVIYDFIAFDEGTVSADTAKEWREKRGVPIEQKMSEEEEMVYLEMLNYDFLTYENKYANELCVVIRGINSKGEKAIITIESSYKDIRMAAYRIFNVLVSAVCIIGLITFLIIHLSLRNNVTKPAHEVTRAMNVFMDGDMHGVAKLDEKRNDEFGIINRTFNSMVESIDKHVKNTIAINEIQERQKAEMGVSARIQQGFLPEGEAEFAGCEIRAVMRPALDVGGDMYDYMQIDEDNVLVLVADVSGKGLGAAMFMAAALMLLHQFAREGNTPDVILEKTNTVLAQKNPNMLFVTAFVGIYNNKTRVFTYSNAGHNMPYVLGGGTVKTLEGAHGTILGLFDDEKYERDMVSLANGDALYLYTDGVNEATNANKKFYGTDGLENALLSYKPSYKMSLLGHVESSLDAFVDGASQADDITMLTLTAKSVIELKLDADTREFEKIKRVVLASDIPDKYKLQLCVAAEEIFVNICSYAFEGIEREKLIEMRLAVSDHIEMSFTDNGTEYDPREHVIDRDEYDIYAQTGGLGKLLAFSIADDVLYEYKNSRNILTIIKYEEAEI